MYQFEDITLAADSTGSHKLNFQNIYAIPWNLSPV
jgi:hypothetical protein